MACGEFPGDDRSSGRGAKTQHSAHNAESRIRGGGNKERYKMRYGDKRENIEIVGCTQRAARGGQLENWDFIATREIAYTYMCIYRSRGERLCTFSLVAAHTNGEKGKHRRRVLCRLHIRSLAPIKCAIESPSSGGMRLWNWSSSFRFIGGNPLFWSSQKPFVLSSRWICLTFVSFVVVATRVHCLSNDTFAQWYVLSSYVRWYVYTAIVMPQLFCWHFTCSSRFCFVIECWVFNKNLHSLASIFKIFLL